MKLLTYQSVKDKIVHLQEQDVIFDFAVAELYGVETREINQAVKNNPSKFQKGMCLNLVNRNLKSCSQKI